ncbi:MAG: ATP-binding protein [Bacteroidales bacterium]|nr:ATP-binding protein [Bacteroidales bacterium]
MIKRSLQSQIEADLVLPKIQVLFGPRQIGKTTLIESVFKRFDEKKLWLNADDADVRETFANANGTRLKQLFGDFKLLVIDEVQRIENAGLVLKIIADQLKPLHVIATGSSAFELRDKISESMAGRAIEYRLFPFWMQELADHTSIFEEKRLLEHRLIYGYYPEVVNNPGNEKKILQQICDSNLYKDIYALTQVKKPYLLEKILQALALQVGSEVSFNELSNLVGADKETIERYIFLLEQAFVVYRLPSFSRNLRNEINKGRKIYFYDNGIRNSIISNFAPLNLRSDKGALWENYLMTERLKKITYNRQYCNRYFWRTRQQQEIDYLEEYDGVLHAFEFKYSKNSGSKLPLTFSKAYPQHAFAMVDTGNYENFVLA